MAIRHHEVAHEVAKVGSVMVALVSRSRPISAFKALGDVTRWEILQLASAAGEISRTELQAVLRLSKPALSNHLGVLADAGLLIRRPAGRVTFYSVNQAELKAASEVLCATEERGPGISERVEVTARRPALMSGA